MNRTNYVKAFSGFVFALRERSASLTAVELFQWSLERLSQAIDADASWGGWADLTNGEVELCASFSYNLPSSYENFWWTIRKDDILAQEVLGGRNQSAFYDRQGSRQTEGMAALSDRFGIDKMAVVVSAEGSGPVSMFMSPYRSGSRSTPLEPEALDFVRCALDHVRDAALRRISDSPEEGTMLVNSEGRILDASQAAVRMLGRHWPGWRRGYLPADLLDCASTPQKRRLGERGLAVTRREVAHVPGQPLFVIGLRPAGPCDRMTARERQIATLIATGRTHKEIATLLQISPATVRNRTQAMLAKAGVHSKAALSNLLASAPPS